MAENFLPISRLHDAFESLAATSELEGNYISLCEELCTLFAMMVYCGHRKMNEFYINAW